MKSKQSLLRSIFTGSLIFYALAGVTSLLNYAYYPLLARAVGTTAYGEVQFLTASFMQLSVGFTVLNILAIVVTARYPGEHDRQKALRALNAIATTAILAVIILGSIALGTAKSSFGFTSVVPILWLSVTLLVNVPFTIAIGHLQGQGKFVRSGLTSAFASLSELALALAFVKAGWGSSGAIAGIAAGLAVATITAKAVEGSRSRRALTRTVHFSLRSSLALYTARIKHFKNERGLLLAALVAMSILTILSTADILTSKILLSPHQAGQYAGVATISKVILYATAPLMWLALPLALADLPETRKKVHRYIGFAAIIGLGGTVLFSTLRSTIITDLLGIHAGTYVSLLPLTCIAMALMGIALIFVATDLCRDRLRSTTAASLGALLGFIVSFGLAYRGGAVRAAIIGQIIAASLAIIIIMIGNKPYGKR